MKKSISTVHCAVTLKEEQRLRVFEDEVLKKIFGLKRDEVAGDWLEDYITRSFMICNSHQISTG